MECGQMITSVTDLTGDVTQIRTSVSTCTSEVDFEHVLKDAVSVDEMQETEEKETETASGKKTLSQIFEAAAQKYNVPLSLLKAVAKQESDFDVNCVSYAGAQGLMQLMPSTARSLGVTDAFDAEQNVMAGAKYLSQKLKMYDGNVRLALAAYNAGSGNVSKYGGVPPFKETKNYIKKVLGYMKQDVSIPDVTVKVSGSSSSSSVKRQAQANTLELKAEDVSTEAKASLSPSQEMVSVSSGTLADTISEKLKLYYQEQSQTSVSSVMEKLLSMTQTEDSE
jgi:SLT domain-containing protein